MLPDHWIKQLFLAHTYLELQMNEEALKMYENADKCGLSRSTYIMSQKALAYHNLRGVLHVYIISQKALAYHNLRGMLHVSIMSLKALAHQNLRGMLHVCIMSQKALAYHNLGGMLHVYIMSQTALVYHNLGFMLHVYIMSLMALACHNILMTLYVIAANIPANNCVVNISCFYFLDVDLAVESFAKLQKFDPYRIENMDTYSNLLYVKASVYWVLLIIIIMFTYLMTFVYRFNVTKTRVMVAMTRFRF